MSSFPSNKTLITLLKGSNIITSVGSVPCNAVRLAILGYRRANIIRICAIQDGTKAYLLDNFMVRNKGSLLFVLPKETIKELSKSTSYFLLNSC